MAERDRKCRYWPECTVHLGPPALRSMHAVGDLERARIRAEVADGRSRPDVARAYRISQNVLHRVLAGHSNTGQGRKPGPARESDKTRETA